MGIPLSHEQEAVALFDAYCKAVIQNKARRFWARIRARRAYEELLPDVDVIADENAKMDGEQMYTILLGDIRADFENERLYCAVQKLKRKEKAVIVLKYWYEYTDKAIAQWLGVTERTVRNLKKRAHEKLTARLLERTKDDAAYL